MTVNAKTYEHQYTLILIEKAIEFLIHYPELESEYPRKYFKNKKYFLNDSNQKPVVDSHIAHKIFYVFNFFNNGLTQKQKIRYENYCCLLWNLILCHYNEYGMKTSDSPVFAIQELVLPHTEWFQDEIKTMKKEHDIECVTIKNFINKMLNR